MIQTLFLNFLFGIRFNDVQNLNIFIDHFESQKTRASTTLKFFLIVHLICGTNVPCKLQTSIYLCQALRVSVS